MQEARQLSLELHDRATLVWASQMEGAIWLFRGDFETAYALFDESKQIAVDIHVPILLALATVFDAARAMIEVDFDRALSLVETGLKHDNLDRPDPAVMSFASVVIMTIHAARGDYNAVRAHVSRILDIYGGSNLENLQAGGVSWFAPVNIFRLALDDEAEAAVEFYSTMMNAPNNAVLWFDQWPPFVELRQRLAPAIGG